MSRIDFYVLPDAGEPARQRFACRLAEKVYKLDNTVHIATGDRQRAEQLDELLWTFRDGSFVPHEIVAPNLEPLGSPITIGYGAADVGSVDLLINLTDEPPRDAAAFPRIAEIVTSDEDSRQRSRRRFADYRDNGHTLDTHKL